MKTLLWLGLALALFPSLELAAQTLVDAGGGLGKAGAGIFGGLQ